ncbi:hypothetical protein T492DRAFT_859096 [Pavlovales sp. CCMP2436]|nr:hypothetical protein T492DRAFT_859096 [Pavlovales sp. CCMP2436]
MQLLRSKCVEALGSTAFEKAHAFLKVNKVNGVRPGVAEWAALEVIVGEGRADYIAVLDQLVFIENLACE